MNLLNSLRLQFRAFKWVLTGEIIQQIEVPVSGGLQTFTLQLKRERRSGQHYIVLVGRGSGIVWYDPFEVGDLDKLIGAADDIRSAQTEATGPSEEPTRLWQCARMIVSGEVIRRIDTITTASMTMSLRLKRAKGTGKEYVVLATTTPGRYLYYLLQLDEFHRFVATAKKIRAAAESAS
jgi:hypothetical protein